MFPCMKKTSQPKDCCSGLLARWVPDDFTDAKTQFWNWKSKIFENFHWF
jgi:hypothetical protein